MRIAIGGISHETNTFSPLKTTLFEFKSHEWQREIAIIREHEGVRDYLGGMIAEARRQEVELVPTFNTSAPAGGIIPKETYDVLLNELLSALKEALPVDGVCLALHGGGIAEGEDDLEGAILSEVRKIVGPEVPIVATLDLHANLTKTMVQAADALFGVNFYPHTDCYERGEEAIRNLIAIIKGEIKPFMNLVKLPMMLASATTDFGPAKKVNELCWKVEQHPDVIDCTFFHGFSQTDLPDMRAGILVITNKRDALAKEFGRDLAKRVWDMRHEFYQKLPGPREGLEQALQIEGGPVVINETSDNPGAGTPGDGTHLLKALLDMNIEKSVFASIYDPAVAETAHRVGVGERIHVFLGGKIDPLHGEPLEVNAYVKTLSDGKFIQTHPMGKGQEIDLGKTARLQVGNVDVIVTSQRKQTLDEQIFLLHGIDVREYKIVALKSENHFRAVFQPIAKEIITVDSPGISSYNLRNYPYKRVMRPVLPLDPL